MLKNLVLLLVLLYSTYSIAENSCELESYAQIVKINKVLDDSIVKNTNCPNKVRSHFIQLVSNANGKLNAGYLQRYFQQELNQNVQLVPATITVKQLKAQIEDQINPDEKFILKNVTSLYSYGSLRLDEKQNLNITCNNCDSSGTKNILVKAGKNRFWVSAKLFEKLEAYVLKKDITSLTATLTKNDFERKIVTGVPNNFLFHDIKNISYYRPIRYLRKGDVIKRHDFTSKTLIRYGAKVKLLIKGKNLNLKSMGLARGNGKIGEFINIVNPKSNKKFQAKVVDFNTAVVEL